jgi:hypothetical protein
MEASGSEGPSQEVLLHRGSSERIGRGLAAFLPPQVANHREPAPDLTASRFLTRLIRSVA